MEGTYVLFDTWYNNKRTLELQISSIFSLLFLFVGVLVEEEDVEVVEMEAGVVEVVEMEAGVEEGA